VTASTTNTRRGSFARAIRAIGGHLTPCALRLGEPDRVTQSLTSSVARQCYHERSTARVRRRYARLSSSKRLDRRARDPASPRRLKRGKNRDPGRLPSVRSSILQSSEPVRIHGQDHATGSHPFARAGVTLLVRRAPPGRATRPQLQLASRLASRATGKMLLADLCNRLSETSTQGPFGFPSARREPCRSRETPAETRIQPRRRATF
jgi:hypothetical protein